MCPEVTGKPSQFGSLIELLQLKKDTGCGITVDFSHLYARQQGDIDYARILKKLPKKFHACGYKIGKRNTTIENRKGHGQH